MEAAPREVRNQYMRDYNKKNKEKVKTIQLRYWENKAKKIMKEKEITNK